jgi:hypothetical protein
MKEINRIVNLLRKHLLFGESKKLIDTDAVLKDNPRLGPIVDELEDREKFKKASSEYSRIANDVDGSRQRMLDSIFYQIRKEDFKHQRKKQMRWMMAAASLIIVLSVGFWTWNNFDNQHNTASVTDQFIDILPGNNKAVLRILGANSHIDLNNNSGGIVVGKTLQYVDGKEVIPEQTNDNFLMELITPKGGEYKITLSDGTKVHLNAESKLSYPKTFDSAQRIVTLEGEGYFEVAKQQGRAFIVHTAQEDVKVLGTHFNINAYKNEETSSVSLIEGKVQVGSDQELRLLAPGQQAVNNRGRLSVQPINEEEILAWTNGEFMFNNENLESVMRKISRWYDIDIIVSPPLKDITIWGSVSRYGSFEEILEVIKLTNKDIRFKREGRRVYVIK